MHNQNDKISVNTKVGCDGDGYTGRSSCWKELCHDKMKGANFLIQKTMDSLQELVMATDFPCFTTDKFMLTSPIGENRVAIPSEEPEAYETFYITCLNSYKNKYSSFFNSIRSHTLQN